MYVFSLNLQKQYSGPPKKYLRHTLDFIIYQNMKPQTHINSQVY